MIFIRKPASHPAVLTTKGKRQTRDDHKAFAADRKGFRSGAKKFTFDPTIYGDATVKSALLAVASLTLAVSASATVGGQLSSPSTGRVQLTL